MFKVRNVSFIQMRNEESHRVACSRVFLLHMQ